MTRLRRGAGVALATLLCLMVVDSQAMAANGDDFDPGYIISDEVFYNPTTMTVGDVQAFLDAKGAACVSGAVPCLKDFVENTESRDDALWRLCADYQGKPNQTAAQIIVEIGRLCGVNPQVLLVLLEKEQSLVSTRTPTARRYEIAAGFGCPDTAACDELYYGFVNQLFRAARQYQRYRAVPYNYGHIAGRVNSILYHPNSACGRSDVYIRNQATAGLYNYTPYRPNQAALDNLYGTGNSCSSYGNRNFWRIFTDWFGSTTNQGHRITPKRDWDGDSYADIVARRSDGYLYWYAGRPGRMSFTRNIYGRGWSSMTSLAQTHNFLGNGRPELFAINRGGDLYAYEGTGSGKIRTVGKVGHGWTSMDALVGIDSWGVNGTPALLARHQATGSVYIYPSTGTGGFAPSTHLNVDWSGYDEIWYAGDWNADGSEDIVARGTADGHLYLIPGRRNGTFGDPVRIGSNWRGISEIMGGGDWNQDGRLDLLGRGTDGRLWLYGSNGAGGFAATQQIGVGWTTFDFAD
ncbi:FG-GAP-like repeat-containing protein [Demequina aestuarii]|uniref:FG-GAP-like repeat-containing protein n=1 Tax=Demequina aestuarii TaxID=327095 RepID=UPI00078336E4|nr:FG-GAP-like repeat-containing protein [Demequina aestuarii]